MILSSDALDTYIHEHTTVEAEIFQRLREETYANLEMPQMQVGRVEGGFLRLMVQLSGAKNVLEIGTFSGYSGLALASGLPDDGSLISCDIDPVATKIARRYFDESPWGKKIEIRLAPAGETIAALGAENHELDLVFIDADKGGYIDYWEGVLPLLRPGGIVLADNTLWSAKVLDPKEASDHAIVRFNAHVKADPRVEHVLLSVRDGIMMARKK